MASATQPEILPPLSHEPLPPMTWPVVVWSDRTAHVPDAFTYGAAQHRPVCEGIGVAWAPALEIGSVLLCIAGGNPARPTREMVVATISREELVALIADLQSIDAQLWPDSQ